METNSYDPSVRNFKISLALAAGIAAFGIVANLSGWTLSHDFNKAIEHPETAQALNTSLVAQASTPTP